MEMLVMQKLIALFFFVGLSSATSEATRPTSITVTGVVLCNRCLGGVQAGIPLPGVQVELEYTTDQTRTFAFTDATGAFKLALDTQYFARNGGDSGRKYKYLIRIVKNPDSSCQTLKSTMASLPGVAGRTTKNEIVYSLEPFIVTREEPACLPPAIRLPPLPPGIFPFPHPGYGHAPPIESSPFLPFYPPPFVEQPSRWPPPPPNAEPPAIVIPPRPISPRPPLLRSKAAPPPPPRPVLRPPPESPWRKRSPLPPPKNKPAPPLHFPSPALPPPDAKSSPPYRFSPPSPKGKKPRTSRSPSPLPSPLLASLPPHRRSAALPYLPPPAP